MSENRIQKVEILRYDPEQDTKPHWQRFDVPFDNTMSTLDALGYIKDNLDKNLSYRWSCRMAICGSCGIMVNGVPKLACKSFLRDYPDGIKIEPLANFPIEKDLIVDMTPFIERLEAIKPYIIGNDRDICGDGFHSYPPVGIGGVNRLLLSIEKTLKRLGLV